MNVNGQLPPLDSFLPYQITRLANLLSQRTAVIAREAAGLTLSQWRVLAAVADRPACTAREVVAVTPMDKGAVSKAVKSLIDMNMLRREASRDDGRISLLNLSPKGRRAYLAIATEVRQLEDRLYAGLAAQEGRAFLEKLKSMAERLG